MRRKKRERQYIDKERKTKTKTKTKRKRKRKRKREGVRGGRGGREREWRNRIPQHWPHGNFPSRVYILLNSLNVS